MDEPRHQVRLSFQLKVLLPVLAALVLVPAITLWIVNQYVSRQMQDESRQTLHTSENVFQQLLELRTRATARSDGGRTGRCSSWLSSLRRPGS